jgi:hypothetical protein
LHAAILRAAFPLAVIHGTSQFEARARARANPTAFNNPNCKISKVDSIDILTFV